MPGATSIRRSSAAGKWIRRDIKKLAMVWTCPPPSHRRGRNGELTRQAFR
jgi:hypothetical protein